MLHLFFVVSSILPNIVWYRTINSAIFLEKNLVQNHYYLHGMELFRIIILILQQESSSIQLFLQENHFRNACSVKCSCPSHREVFCGGPKGTGQIIFGSGFV